MDLANDPEPWRDVVLKMNEYLKMMNMEEEPFYCRLLASINLIFRCTKTYDISECLLSFNGGKDCTVLLHLLHYVFSKVYGTGYVSKFSLVYIEPEESFEELENFIQVVQERYGIGMIKYKGSIKQRLCELHSTQPHYKVIYMGTRSTDAYGDKVHSVEKTDSDWPEYTLIKPILDWSYHDIWKFLRDLNIPYCPLYDKGFTSLGDRSASFPNSSLAYTNESGLIMYKPAYMLADPELERSGRNVSYR
ncbi:FAD synthase [Trichinella sp. T8]|nr:FAD synthase [Trichinella sp. T8]